MLIEFLNFCWDNREDPRFTLSRRVKYGYDYFYLTWTLENKALVIILDSRNRVIEFSGNFSDDMNIKNEDLLTELIEKWGSEYDKEINTNINKRIEKFFDNTEVSDKDLVRIWKMKNLGFLEEDNDKID